jgi:hypothetical protein
MLDSDSSGGLTSQEFQAAVKKLVGLNELESDLDFTCW